MYLKSEIFLILRIRGNIRLVICDVFMSNPILCDILSFGLKR
jgi:hypothetical protein